MRVTKPKKNQGVFHHISLGSAQLERAAHFVGFCLGTAPPERRTSVDSQLVSELPLVTMCPSTSLLRCSVLHCISLAKQISHLCGSGTQVTSNTVEWANRVLNNRNMEGDDTAWSTLSLEGSWTSVHSRQHSHDLTKLLVPTSIFFNCQSSWNLYYDILSIS